MSPIRTLWASTLVALVASSSAFASLACPSFGAATTGCNTDIVVDSAGNLTAVAGGSPTPYDFSEDNLVGFLNNSASPISSISLTGSNIFGFEGDGIKIYGAPGNSSDPTGYGGPNAFFSNISPSGDSGTVNFITPVAPGGFTYFSLENRFTAGSISGGPGGMVPEPSTLLLLGTGALGMATRLRRRFSRQRTS